MAVATIAMLVFDKQIARLFTRQPEVLFHAVNCLQILAHGYVGWSFGMAVIQVFNGAGDTIAPTFINYAQRLDNSGCHLRYCLALTLGWGPACRGFWAVFVRLDQGVLGVLAFRRGRWRALVV